MVKAELYMNIFAKYWHNSKFNITLKVQIMFHRLSELFLEHMLVAGIRHGLRRDEGTTETPRKKYGPFTKCQKVVGGGGGGDVPLLQTW